MSKIRLLIAEDDSVFRRTLGELLRLEEDIAVVSEVPHGQQALNEAMVLNPDVVLTDIQMPLMDGITLIQELHVKLPACRVVVLSKFGDDERVFQAIKSGALGYVLKDDSSETIAAAIRAAYAGEGVLSPSLVHRVMQEFKRLSASAIHNRKLFSELSRREIEVLECLSLGMKNSQIAEKLYLAEKTVKTHVGAILRKLHVNDRTEAALLAKEQGINP